MPRRFFLVGTDTDCGKTTVACALLRAGVAAGVKMLPFKPAASGAVPGDPERLIAAAGLVGLTVEQICPLRFAPPVAPGLAADGGVETFSRAASCLSFGTGSAGPGDADIAFSDGSAGAGDPGTAGGSEIAAVSEALGRLEARYRPDLTGTAGGSEIAAVSGALGRLEARYRPDLTGTAGGSEIAAVSGALGRLEARYRPDLTLIEGAGGLYVPMPGGSWLPGWIRGLAAQPIVVGRLGLGTINHCLLTFAALERLGLRPRGFILAQTVAGGDPSHAHNERVIAAASGLPCLGVLGFAADERAHGWLRGGVAALLA